MTNLQLTSSAFSSGNPIPREYGYKNGNKEPPLAISGIPAEAKSLTLIMDDPDAMGAVGKVWVHWVVWNIIPDRVQIDGGDITPIHMKAIAAECEPGMTDFGEVGYGGPAPPDKTHTYVFKLYALDTELDLPQKSTKADVEKAMDGHIIEQTQLTGTYAP
jgi:Raf kinase inhibitor-like YbhB/YbcL family protein